MDYKEILEDQIKRLQEAQDKINGFNLFVIEISRQIQPLTETLINNHIHM